MPWNCPSELEERMPTQIPVKVACCLQESAPLAFVKNAVAAEGGKATKIEWQDLVTDGTNAIAWSAMVYDLEPLDARTCGVIRAFRERHIAAPILLYVPTTQDTGRFLEQLTRLPGVFVRLQCDCHDDVTGLRDDVRRVFEAMPAYRLGTLIDGALPDLPDRLRIYVKEVLAVLATTNRPVRVSTGGVAARMGVAVRTLERASCSTNYPKPKELLSWVVLLYLALLASYEQVSPCKIGRLMGLSTGTTSRLRRRLLTPAQSEIWKKDRDTTGAKFDLVFAAFVKRCGLPGRVAFEALGKDMGATPRAAADEYEWPVAAEA